jgi:hypothetical protein
LLPLQQRPRERERKREGERERGKEREREKERVCFVLCQLYPGSFARPLNFAPLVVRWKSSIHPVVALGPSMA